MRNRFFRISSLASVLLATLLASAKDFRLDSTGNLILVEAKAEVVKYKGRHAVRLTEKTPNTGGEALLKGIDFHDGLIEVDVVGLPAAGADPGARGFVGISFRSSPDATRYECFWIRPTNGRADDQLRRNHSTQYASYPEYPWKRLRQGSPGVYESYVDLETGAWTHLRIVVDGVHAKLYVNGAKQPALIVNDLKHGDSRGQVGLWIGSYAEAYFSNLKIEPATRGARQ